MPRSIADIRKANGGLENLTDEDILQATYEEYAPYYKSLDDYASAVGYGGAGRGMASSRVSAGIDNYQANMYGLGGAAARALGARDVGNWMDERRDANEQAANYATQRARDLGAVDTFSEVRGPGDFINYAGGLAAQSLPYAAEALAGGLVGRGLAVGTRAALAGARTTEEAAAAARSLGRIQTAGGTVASYPSAVGDILSNQREAGGEDLSSAMVGGVPYAALNAFGVEGVAARGLRPLAAGESRTARMLTGAASTALGEGLGETGQEMANQYFGRMAVNPTETLFSQDAVDRYKESFIGGATLGGLVGGAGGIRKPYAPRTVDEGQFDITQTQESRDAMRAARAMPGFVGGTNPNDAFLAAAREAQPTVAETQQEGKTPTKTAAPSSIYDDVDRALMDRGVAPNKLRKALFTEVQAAGIDPEHELLSPFWTLMSSGSTGKAKTELAKAIAAYKKEQLDGTPSAPVAPVVSGSAGPGVDAGGSVGTGGSVPALDGGRSGDSGNTQPAGQQVLSVAATGGQQPTVVNTQQSPAGVAKSQQRVRSMPGFVGSPANTSLLANATRMAPAAETAPNQNTEPLVDTSDDAAEIARMTGNSATVDAMRADDAGQRLDANTEQDQATLDEGAQKIIDARFADSKNKDRDVSILRAYITAMRAAPRGNKLALQKAIGKTFGVSPESVRAVGNPQELVRIGESLGYDGEAVMAMFDTKNNARTESSESGKLAYQLKQLKKDYAEAKTKEEKDALAAQMSTASEKLAKAKDKEDKARTDAVASGLKDAGVEFDAEEGSGMGGLDEDRFWQEESTKGSRAANDILALADQIDALREALGEYETQGMDEVAETIRDQIEAQQLKLDKLMADINANPSMAEKKAAPPKATKVVKAKKAVAETEEDTSGLTTAEKAERAWDAVAEEYPEAPKFADLTKDQQADFIEYGEENWTPDDVRTELTKLAKEMNTPQADVLEAVSANGTEINEADVEVDKQLRGKSFEEATKWALDNASNEFERAVMRAVSARLADLAKRGVNFRFFVTPEGKQLTGGASGLTVSTPAGLGEAMRVDVVLNGAHTGETSGTNFVTLAHELIHAATQAQLKFQPKGSLAREFQEFYSELAKGVRERQANGTSLGWEKRFWKGNNNSLRDADELLAWGLTDKGFQKYLNEIQVTPKQTMWDRFVNLVAKALGIPVRANSALARLMQLSEGLLDENLDPYVAEANSQFQSLGKQENTTQWPNWSLNADLGAPVWVEGDLALYRATARNGNTLFVPGMRSGDTSATAKVDVNNFTGTNISRADLAKMRKVADGMRQQSSPRVANATPKAVQKEVSDLTRVLGTYGSKALNAVMFSSDLFKRAASMGIGAAKDLGDLYQKRAALTGKIEREVIRIEQMFNRIPDASRKDANEFVRDMRFAKKWGFRPEWRGDLAEKADMDEALENRYNDLPKEAQDWAQALFEHGDKMRQLKQDAVRNSFASVYDARIADAKAANDTDKVTALEKEKAAELTRYKRLFAQDERNPYAPVRRFGNWVVVGKSQEYLDAEAAGDKKRMAELETDADHYYVDFRENFGEAAKLANSLRENGLDVAEPREKEPDRNDMYGGLMSAFDKLRGNIESELSNATTAEEKKALRAAREAVVDLYLRSLADTSARKSELRFKGIAGDIDMLRSFSSQGRADAHFLAAATYNPQMTETIVKMRQQAKQRGNDTEKSMAFKEMMLRHEQSMKYQEGGWFEAANRATAVTSGWLLATSPMYYLQNLTQPGVISVPYMTGKHAYNDVWGQLLRSYHQLGPLLKSFKALEGFDLSKLPDDVRDAMMVLAERQRIDVGMDTELGNVKLEGDSVAAKATNRVSQFFRSLAQKAETINRVSTAMAAYRLELKRTGDAAAALEYADEVLDKTHGDYTRANAPRLFNTPAGKVALQFRKFQLIQLTLLTKLTHDAFKGASPAERGAARKMLAYTLGHTGVLAGVVGMPGFAAASFIINKLADMFGDDDEPYNLENELRKALGDGQLARIVMRGAPMAANMDISGKVGMGTALSILPYTDVDMTREGFNAIATGLTLGATGGLGARVWEALGDVKNGDYYRGLAGLMPKGLADAMKGWDAFNNGITRKNGELLVSSDNMSTFEGIAKAIGLTTANESERRFDQQVVYDNKQAFEDRANQLKNQYVRARKQGDSEAAQKAMQGWQNLQRSRREAGMTVQPVSTLLKAPMQQMKRERMTSGGVQYDKQTRRMVMQQTGE